VWQARKRFIEYCVDIELMPHDAIVRQQRKEDELLIQPHKNEIMKQSNRNKPSSNNNKLYL